MEKPYKVVKLDSPQEIERLDNLLTLLFNNLQEIRHRVSSTTPVVSQLKEGEIIFLDDGSGDRQLYAKIKNSLFHIPIKAICKAWVNFDGTTNVGGNCTIHDSYGVDHVEDLATGQYKVWFTTNFANTNYAVIGSALFLQVGADTAYREVNECEVRAYSGADAAYQDRDAISVMFLGVQ